MALRPNQKSAGKGNLSPYIVHFALFVTVFFSIIGGALFFINFASAYAV